MVRLNVVLFLFLLVLPGEILAQPHVTFHKDKPHHLSLLIGGTYIDYVEDTFFTLGLDYEYRINKRFGVGAVLEQTFGDIEATTFLAVADIHVWRGLIFQVGPGIEYAHNETFAMGRFGILYEIESENKLTLSPQLHYDVSSGEDAIVFGIAIGQSF